MTFALRPDGPKEDMPKDRSGIIFGPVNADITIDVPELQIAAEQVRQEAGGSTTTSTTEVATASAADGWLSGRWYTTHLLNELRDGGNAGNSPWVTSTGIAYPLILEAPATIDAIGVMVTDNTGTPSTTPPAGGLYYTIKLGIYDDNGGKPGVRLVETTSFSYGDGTLPNNTLEKRILATALSLSAGKYWVVMRKSTNVNLPNPAYLMSRGLRFREGPQTEADINTTSTIGGGIRSALSINFPSSPATTVDLPENFSTTIYTFSALRATYGPEIWLRQA